MKILEKCIKSRVVNFLEKQTFFSNKQFGFRAGLYTRDALFNIDNFIRKKNIDENAKVMGIFLDEQKAFVFVNHKLLIKRLDRSGTRSIKYFIPIFFK